MVAHRNLGHVIQIYIAENTAHSEHVLTFEIRAVAPAEHLHRYGIVARAQVLGEVKLAHIVCSLGIAYILAVYPDESCRVYAAEMNKSPVAVPVFRHIEMAQIRAYRIDAVVCAAVIESTAGIDIGRSVAVRVLHIGVYRTVIALHLPVGRHRNGVP